jgi:PAS domain S-box-containing protein
LVWRLQSLNHAHRVTIDLTTLEHPNRKSGIRVLHVDDDPVILEISKQILMDMGDFEIDHACCVDEAFQKLSAGHYDAVISDYEMPQKDGLEFLKELHEQNNTIPFILFTGKGREEVAIKALNLGADGYIDKQGTPETVYGELSHTIRQTVEHTKTKKELEERDVRLSKLASQTPGMLFQFKRRLDGRYSVPYTSGGIWGIFGCSPQDVLEDFSPIVKAIVPEDLDKVIRSIEVSALNMTVWHCEYRVQLPGEQIRWVWGQSTPEKLEDGSIIWNGYNADITESKKTEENLKQIQDQLKVTIVNAPIGIATSDSKNSFLSANEAFCEILGFSENELKKLTFKDITHPADAKQSFALMEELNSGRLPFFSQEKRYIRKDGTIITGKITVGAIRDKEGKPALHIVELEDITEQKHEKEALKDSEAKLRCIVENSSDQIFMLDKNYKYLSANKALANVLGKSPKDIVGKSISEVYSPETAAIFSANIKNVFGTGKTMFIEEKMVAQGQELYISTSLNPVQDDIGCVIAVAGIVRDITQSKKAEEELKKINERFGQVIENVEEFVWEVDAVGVYTFVSSAMERMLGYKTEEVVGKKSFYDFFHPDDKEELKKGAFSAFDGKASFKGFINRNMARDGSIVWLSTSGVPIVADDDMLLGYRGVDANVTVQKKIEEALKQERDMLESVTKNIGAGLVMISKDYRILWMNNYLRQFTGASENNHCYSSFNTCTDVCPDCGPKKIFEGAEFDHREYCNQTEFNKDRPVWFELIATPIKDSDGNVVAALELTVNITEKKEAEKKLKVTSRKIELMNEKLRVVGELTRHDVRNKLSAFTGYAYLMKKKHADQADIVDGLGKMEQAVKESMKIFEFAKTYEQLGVEELDYIDVEKTVTEASALFPDLTLKVANYTCGLRLLADSFLRQLFYNLIDNTRKYAEKATIIRVYSEKTNAGELRLTYEDNGVGISAKNKLKLFKEGFSTGSTTGFGLFLTKRMMDVYGWQIQETGEPGKGAKFTLTIPKLSKNGKENYQIVQ